MKIILNETELTVTENPIDDLNSRLAKDNLVISSIHVNGAEMVNITLEELFKEMHDELFVTINAVTAVDLIIEALKESLVYIPRLKSGLLELRERVLEGNLSQVKQTIDQALEGLDWVITASRAAAGQFAVAPLDRVFEKELEKVLPAFKELETALREEDYTLCCDLFEYEVIPFLECILDVNNKALEESAISSGGDN